MEMNDNDLIWILKVQFFNFLVWISQWDTAAGFEIACGCLVNLPLSVIVQAIFTNKLQVIFINNGKEMVSNIELNSIFLL